MARYEEVTGDKRNTDWTDTSDTAAALTFPDAMMSGDAAALKNDAGLCATPKQLTEKAAEIVAMEGAFDAMDARGFGKLQQRHRQPIPARPTHAPIQALPMASSAPQPLPPPSGISSSLTAAAAATAPPEDPQGQVALSRDEKRKLLRRREIGTAAEQNIEIERHREWSLRHAQSRRQKRSRKEAGAEEAAEGATPDSQPMSE